MSKLNILQTYSSTDKLISVNKYYQSRYNHNRKYLIYVKHQKWTISWILCSLTFHLFLYWKVDGCNNQKYKTSLICKEKPFCQLIIRLPDKQLSQWSCGKHSSSVTFSFLTEKLILVYSRMNQLFLKSCVCKGFTGLERQSLISYWAGEKAEASQHNRTFVAPPLGFWAVN